ncbi:MAG: SUMF1/EgtB/PvdO family nonheme iron enzyme [Candidatus Thiodiazotropha sp. 6PLUC4]
MTAPAILSQLSGLYEMQQHLLESRSDQECATQHHPTLASLNWYFGNGVYLELYWLRSVLCADDSLSSRVKHLFTPGTISLKEQCENLPPTDHLINWGAEIRDEHLRLLATPGSIPDHPLMKDDRLAWYLLQEQAKLYECMLLVINQLNCRQTTPGYLCMQPLQPAPPSWETKELSQGHYRIGSRDDPRAYDNELPPQAVELSGYRTALTPVSNAQFLSFMQANGYQNKTYWSEAGWEWQLQHQADHPEYWQQDPLGNWYEVALNGPSHLPPDEPVTGINLYEAEAFASWASQQQDQFSGAILQHEYQWEMAARSGVLTHSGRGWEWCSNRLHPYPEFQPFPDESTSKELLSSNNHVLKGGSVHTQKVLRRASYRHWALPSERHHYTSARLVFPPLHKWN